MGFFFFDLKVLNVSVPADSVPGQKITAVASSGDEVSVARLEA
jgi:hypothetical protein